MAKRTRVKAARTAQRVTRPRVMRGPNVDALAAAAARSADMLPKRALVHAPVYVSTNKQTARARPVTRRKVTPLRVSVTKTLAKPKATRPALAKDALYESLCGEYNRQRKQRRASMFASGSAGKGRRNTGTRKADWRKRYC